MILQHINLTVRGVGVFVRLLLSTHPGDAFVWLKSMVARRRPLSYPIPWLTFPAIRALRKHVTSDSKIFEYGSGHSTVYWASLGATITSVEDCKEWFDVLQQHLGKSSISNVELLFETNHADYVDAISRDGSSFDMIVVDGAHRRECVIAAVPLLKPGGVFVVDNTSWSEVRNRPIEGIPDGWTKVAFPGYAPMLGHKSETTVWYKPD